MTSEKREQEIQYHLTYTVGISTREDAIAAIEKAEAIKAQEAARRAELAATCHDYDALVEKALASDEYDADDIAAKIRSMASRRIYDLMRDRKQAEAATQDAAMRAALKTISDRFQKQPRQRATLKAPQQIAAEERAFLDDNADD